MVEDNPILQKATGSILASLGYAYEVAESGEKALEMWKEGKYHLILLDIGLPGLSGLEVLKEIRLLENGGNTSTLIVIYSSESGLKEMEIIAADAVLEKPAKPLVLEDTLARLLFKESVYWTTLL